MHFTYSEDYPLLTWILTNPRAYARMRHDALPPPEGFQVEPIAGARWVIGWVGDLPVAAVMMIRKKQRVQIHFCITPRGWGKAYEIGQRFLGWCWRLHHGLKELVAAVPSHNRLALRMAQQAGFGHVGVDPEFGTKDGKPWDLHWFLMKRPKEFAT